MECISMIRSDTNIYILTLFRMLIGRKWKEGNCWCRWGEGTNGRDSLNCAFLSLFSPLKPFHY